MKVHVLGGPGSGKTTFACEVATTFHVPHHDLDLIGWNTHGTNFAAYVDDAAALANQTGWVTEGVHLLWIDPLLEQADAIVMFDINWPVAAWRIIRRHTVKSWQGTNLYPGLRPLANLLRYARNYYLNIHRADPPTATLARQYFAERQARAGAPTLAVTRQDFVTYNVLAIPPTSAFVREYLAAYQAKVWFVQNRADRARLMRHLSSV